MKNRSDHTFWDSLAGRYDSFISKFAKKTYAQSIKLMRQELSADSKVLEIGTGTGIIAFAIIDLVHSIIAIDYAPGMIKTARAKLEASGHKNLQFRKSTATNIDLPDKSFNVIIASNVFHLLPEPTIVLREIGRLLTDDGKIILPTYCHGQNLKTHLLSALMSMSGFKAANKWSTTQFRNFVEQEGWHIEKEEIIKDKFPMSFLVASKNHAKFT